MAIIQDIKIVKFNQLMNKMSIKKKKKYKKKNQKV